MLNDNLYEFQNSKTKNIIVKLILDLCSVLVVRDIYFVTDECATNIFGNYFVNVAAAKRVQPSRSSRHVYTRDTRQLLSHNMYSVERRELTRNVFTSVTATLLDARLRLRARLLISPYRGIIIVLLPLVVPVILVSGFTRDRRTSRRSYRRNHVDRSNSNFVYFILF